MEQRISFLTLGVADLDRAEAFYKALGWTPSSYGVAGEVVFFQLNGMVLGLWGRQNLADDAGLPNSPPQPFSGVSISHNVRTEPEVASVMEAVIAAGGTQLKAPHRAQWGGLIAYFADPDGHVWEICHNPHAHIDEAGSVWLPR